MSEDEPKRTPPKAFLDNMWKPGQSGNPNGRPTVPEPIKAMAKLNKVKIAEIFTKYFYCSLADLQKILGKKEAPAIEMMIISTIVHAFKTGDYKRLNFLLDRTIGPVPREFDVKTDSLADYMTKLTERAGE